MEKTIDTKNGIVLTQQKRKERFEINGNVYNGIIDLLPQGNGEIIR